MLPARLVCPLEVETLEKIASSLPFFFRSTIRELFSPFKALIYDFAEKNATRSGKKEEVGAAPKMPPLPPALWGNRKKDYLIRLLQHLLRWTRESIRRPVVSANR